MCVFIPAGLQWRSVHIHETPSGHRCQIQYELPWFTMFSWYIVSYLTYSPLKISHHRHDWFYTRVWFWAHNVLNPASFPRDPLVELIIWSERRDYLLSHWSSVFCSGPGPSEPLQSPGRTHRSLGRLRRSGSLDSDPDIFKTASEPEKGDGTVRRTRSFHTLIFIVIIISINVWNEPENIRALTASPLDRPISIQAFINMIRRQFNGILLKVSVQ